MQLFLEKNLVQVETTNEVLSLVGDDVYAVYQDSFQIFFLNFGIDLSKTLRRFCFISYPIGKTPTMLF